MRRFLGALKSNKSQGPAKKPASPGQTKLTDAENNKSPKGYSPRVLKKTLGAFPDSSDISHLEVKHKEIFLNVISAQPSVASETQVANTLRRMVALNQLEELGYLEDLDQLQKLKIVEEKSSPKKHTTKPVCYSEAKSLRAEPIKLFAPFPLALQYIFLGMVPSVKVGANRKSYSSTQLASLMSFREQPSFHTLVHRKSYRVSSRESVTHLNEILAKEKSFSADLGINQEVDALTQARIYQPEFIISRIEELLNLSSLSNNAVVQQAIQKIKNILEKEKDFLNRDHQEKESSISLQSVKEGFKITDSDYSEVNENYLELDEEKGSDGNFLFLKQIQKVLDPILEQIADPLDPVFSSSLYVNLVKIQQIVEDKEQFLSHYLACQMIWKNREFLLGNPNPGFKRFLKTLETFFADKYPTTVQLEMSEVGKQAWIKAIKEQQPCPIFSNWQHFPAFEDQAALNRIMDRHKGYLDRVREYLTPPVLLDIEVKNDATVRVGMKLR